MWLARLHVGGETLSPEREKSCCRRVFLQLIMRSTSLVSDKEFSFDNNIACSCWVFLTNYCCCYTFFASTERKRRQQLPPLSLAALWYTVCLLLYSTVAQSLWSWTNFRSVSRLKVRWKIEKQRERESRKGVEKSSWKLFKMCAAETGEVHEMRLTTRVGFLGESEEKNYAMGAVWFISNEIFALKTSSPRVLLCVDFFLLCETSARVCVCELYGCCHPVRWEKL